MSKYNTYLGDSLILANFDDSLKCIFFALVYILH